jgi:BsuBI/PstI restriction endonuclease HTH domain
LVVKAAALSAAKRFKELLSRDIVRRRLEIIFPLDSPKREVCTSEAAASTVFVALYVNAIEEAGRDFAVKHIYRMTDTQASLTHDASRNSYYFNIISRHGYQPPGQCWYHEHMRTPIRDQTLLDGLVPAGAVLQREIPRNSNKPRYALQRAFAALFDPTLERAALEMAAAQWRREKAGGQHAPPPAI